jgi:CHASE2 domain-containing sensor protein
MSVPSLLLEEEFRPGRQLGDYTLVERIGFGGQAVIWSAWSRRRAAVVIIKLIPTLGEDASANLDDFEREVQLVASLNHPNILPLYEFGLADEYRYLVMRYICSGSLRDLLAAGPTPPQVALHLMAQMVSALQYLHARNIVHRDLKPGNILVDTAKRAYLADFGLARRISQETAPLHTGRGTGPYAPPEQVSGLRVTPQSDIYSLGILLYEMLTGELPWGGSRYLSIQQLQMATSLPDPRDLNPALPASLVTALQRLTAADRADRPASAAEAFNLVAETLLVGKDNVEQQEAFSFLYDALSEPVAPDHSALAAQDAQYLLDHTLPDWTPEAEPFPLSATHVAFINSVYMQAELHGLALTDSQRHFLLRGALAHGQHLDYWWRQVDTPLAQVQACEQTIAYEDEEAVGRALTQMLGEPAGTLPLEALTPAALDRLIELAAGAKDAYLRANALDLLEHSISPPARWQPIGVTLPGDRQLAILALGGGAQAQQAARLIGQMHSEAAVRVLFEQEGGASSPTLLDALKEIRVAAGSLPRWVPLAARLQVSARLTRDQLLEEREGLSWPRALIGLAVGLLASLMMALRLFPGVDAQMRDILLQPYPVSNIATIVEVNDASLERYGRWDSWPRTLHAQLINQLSAAGAGVIVMDFTFASATPADAALADAMRQAGNVVQPVLGQGDAFGTVPGVVYYEGGVWPQPDLLASAAVGHTNIVHDVDGYVRRIPTVIAIGEERYPSLALAAVEVYLGSEVEYPAPCEGRLAAAGRQIPVDTWGQMWIHYAGPPSQPGAAVFQTVSYQDVLDGVAPPELLKDKIVLVGITATAEPDRYLTPVSRGRPMYGVEILANVIETIWSGRFITLPALWLRVGILVLLGALTGLACVRPWLGLALTFVLAALYFAVASVLFDLRGVMLDLLFPFLTIALSYATVTAYRLSFEARHRRRAAWPRYETEPTRW